MILEMYKIIKIWEQVTINNNNNLQVAVACIHTEDIERLRSVRGKVNKSYFSSLMTKLRRVSMINRHTLMKCLSKLLNSSYKIIWKITLTWWITSKITAGSEIDLTILVLLVETLCKWITHSCHLCHHRIQEISIIIPTIS